MDEARELLKNAVFEIKSLRRQNELMRARLDMFDDLNQILHTSPATQSKGGSLDLAWAIEKFLAPQVPQTPEKV